MMMDDLDTRLAARIKALRLQRDWSLTELAERSGVSRAMVHRIEAAKASASAVLLGRLSAAFGLSLSRLLASTEDPPAALMRAADQPLWTDPATGLTRRQVTAGGSPIELVAIELPPGARVAYPAAAYHSIEQAIWVLEGELDFRAGDQQQPLRAGDSLTLGAPCDCEFHNAQRQVCRYVVLVNARA